jgi:hypothetical protein
MSDLQHVDVGKTLRGAGREYRGFCRGAGVTGQDCIEASV